MYLISFSINLLTILFLLYTFIIKLFISDTLQVLMLVVLPFIFSLLWMLSSLFLINVMCRSGRVGEDLLEQMRNLATSEDKDNKNNNHQVYSNHNI